MNSKSLQAKFPEVYRDFFSKCPIVVSVPGNFFWSGEYSVLFGGLAIKQNIPLRVYVGLEPDRHGGFEIGESLTFVPSSSRFEPWDRFTPDVKNKLIEFLNREFRDFWPNANSGFRVNILSEIPPGCGLSLEGGFPTALTAAIFLAANLISPATVDRWNQLPVYQLSADKDFDRIFRAAWKVDFTFRSSFASGAPIFFPLAHSVYPIVYFIEEQTEAAVPSLNAIDYRKYWAFRIDELVNLGRKDTVDLGALHTWPVDFGLIFSEDIRDEDATIRSIKETEGYLGIFASWWKNILSKLDIPEGKILFSKIIRDPRLKVGGSYLDALVTVGLEMLYGLGHIFNRGASRETIRDFLRIVNCTHQLLTPLYAPSRVSDEIGFLVDRYVRDLGDDCGAGCRLVVEKKADILFVVNSHILRDRIPDLLTDLRNKTKRDVQLHYASWLDGFEEEGVKIEQCLAEGIYSRFISEGSVSLQNFIKAGRAQNEIISLEEFERKKEKIDLLVDLAAGHIYVRGKKLTSKEIPSSGVTATILNILLNSLGKSVPSSQLPESFYSQDRNEMQSKIVAPLLKVIRTKTKKNLPLKISGGLVEFRMKLDFSDLDIRMLNKVF